MVVRNSLILDVNENILANIFNLKSQIYSKNSYKKYFYEFCKLKNTSFQNDLLKWMKEKFTEKDFSNCSDKNIVYIYTYKNKIVYIGKSYESYDKRLFGFGYSEQLFGEFANKCNFSPKNKDWKFFTYSSKKYSIEDVESYLINWFAKNEQPTLNVKCENIKNLLKGNESI